MAAALTALAFYFIQDKKHGRIIFFNARGYLNKIRRFVDRRRGGKCFHRVQEEAVDNVMDEDEEEHAKILIDHRC